MKNLKISAAILALSLCAAASAQAGVILQDSPFWYEFGFGTTGTFAFSGATTSPSSGGNSVFADDPAWTFTSAGSTLFKVQDAFLRGDQFELYDFGGLVGATSVVAPGGGGSSDPDVTSLDPTYSGGSFLLGAGSHSITIKASVSPFSSGAAYFRDVSATPEPGALPLMALGLIGLAVVARRRA